MNVNHEKVIFQSSKEDFFQTRLKFTALEYDSQLNIHCQK